MNERCNQCGGAFERHDGEITPVLRCVGCGREIPARALTWDDIVTAFSGAIPESR